MFKFNFSLLALLVVCPNFKHLSGTNSFDMEYLCSIHKEFKDRRKIPKEPVVKWEPENNRYSDLENNFDIDELFVNSRPQSPIESIIVFNTLNTLENLAKDQNATGIYKIAKNTYEKDIKDKALEYLEQLAEQNNLKALEILSYYYYKKEPNHQKLFKYANLAIKNGYKEAFNTLGTCYQKGLGTEVNLDKAEEYYLKAYFNKSYHASYNLALLWALSNDPQKNYQAVKLLENVSSLIPEAFNIITKIAYKLKNPEAFYYLGKYYASLNEPDYKQAAKHYNQAFNLNHLEATRELAMLIIRGLGEIEQNIKFGVELLEWNAQRGDTLSNYYLGNLYALGTPEQEIDFTKAAYFYHQAAIKNHSESKYCLAILYHLGYGVQKNLPFAVSLWQEAMQNPNKGPILIEHYLQSSTTTTST